MNRRQFLFGSAAIGAFVLGGSRLTSAESGMLQAGSRVGKSGDQYRIVQTWRFANGGRVDFVETGPFDEFGEAINGLPHFQGCLESFCWERI